MDSTSKDSINKDIENAYKKTAIKAGDQADIYVAGYPKLFSPKGSGVLIDEEEATILNQNAHVFNEFLRSIVDECNNEGYDNIYFVDVETEFDKDGGHGAYSGDEWIKGIKVLKKGQDHEHGFLQFASSYSVHPNEKGTDAYARCMNKAIAENEGKKKNTASGNKLNWVTEPKIKAEDIIVGDRYSYEPSDGSFISSPYVYIKRNGKYGLIDYNGTIKVEPEYDSFNGDDLYGLDEFIAVYDSKSGDTVFGQLNITDNKGYWELVEQKEAYGAPGIGSIPTTFFINENDGKLYCYRPSDIAAEAIQGGADASYIVQKIL